MLLRTQSPASLVREHGDVCGGPRSPFHRSSAVGAHARCLACTSCRSPASEAGACKVRTKTFAERARLTPSSTDVAQFLASAAPSSSEGAAVSLTVRVDVLLGCPGRARTDMCRRRSCATSTLPGRARAWASTAWRAAGAAPACPTGELSAPRRSERRPLRRTFQRRLPLLHHAGAGARLALATSRSCCFLGQRWAATRWHSWRQPRLSRW